MTTKNAHKFLLTPLLCASALACGAEHDPGSHVQSFRVLALQADAPFAQPGDDVNLGSLSHDPAGRSITWGWGVCPSPAGSTPAACLDQFREIVAEQGDLAWLMQGQGQDSVQVSIPTDFLTQLPAEARPHAQLGVVSVACPGSLELDSLAPDVPFRCREATDGRELSLAEYVVGVKRISVRERDRNENPTIEAVLFDGADWPADEVKEVDACDTSDYDYLACPDGLKHRVAARVDAASFETGTDEFEREFSEQVVIQHYSTEGIFESEVRVADEPETGWVARSAASGSELSLWFVARDDRGGVSWTERRVRVR